MRNLLIVLVVIVLIAAGGWWWWTSQASNNVPAPVAATSPSAAKNAPTEVRVAPRKQMAQAQADQVSQSKLAPQVEQVLVKEVQLLQTLSTDATVLTETRTANDKDKNLSAGDITSLDATWIGSKKVTPTIQTFMTNPGALALLSFQKTHPEFKEVFIADAYGLNVAETDKTSDFYQADEWWWVEGMNGGAGKTLHGNIEFDQSSQTEAISL